MNQQQQLYILQNYMKSNYILRVDEHVMIDTVPNIAGHGPVPRYPQSESTWVRISVFKTRNSFQPTSHVLKIEKEGYFLPKIREI